VTISRARQFDILLMTGLLVIAEGETVYRHVGGSMRLAVPLSIVCIAALWWRRTDPLRTLIVVAGTLALLLAGGTEILGAGIALVVAAYSAAAYAASRRTSLIGAAVAIAGVFVQYAAYPHANVGDLISNGFFVTAGWTVGETVRRRKAHADELEEVADALERRREGDALAAVEVERMRIARELHDVIAHNLSAIVLQAIGGRGLLAASPDRVERPLQEIEDLGRETLVEMRRLVGVLRVGSDADARAPQPRLADLALLIDQVTASGVETSLFAGPEIEAVPRGIELSIVRIVQEALTNVRKHAGTGARASVRVELDGDEVVVRITDDGAGQPLEGPGSSGGYGLVGMRERVGMYGGALHAHVLDPAGFEVEARIPLGEGSRSDA
jgi:signal transduction histidine kinase